MSALSKHTSNASLAFGDLELTLNGELATRIEHAEQKVDAERRAPSATDRAGKRTKLAELEAEYEGLLDSMQEHIFALRVWAVAQPKWLEITSKSPARRGNQIDQNYGMDVDKVTRAVVEHTGHIIEDGNSEKPDASEWPEFWDKLTPAQFAKLRDLVWMLNAGGTNLAALKKA